MPFPVFYGYLFYPLLGTAAACLGTPLALRLAILGLMGLQFAQVRRALRRAGAEDRLATVAACLVSWAIYPLTNLYNRGALTEFFATGLLTCAICQWFALLFTTTRGERVRAALAVGLFYALAAGCHPITALYGLVFLAGLAPTMLFRCSRAEAWSRLRALVPAACLALLVLAPWIYACLRCHTALTSKDLFGLSLFPDSLDLWWVRLFPVPLDVRTWQEKTLAKVSTPFLDAQVNVPLLLLALIVAGGLVRSGGGRLALRDFCWLLWPALVGGLFLWLSLSSSPYTLLPTTFQVTQFLYRIVTYVNLAILVLLLLAVGLTRSEAGIIRGKLSSVPLKLVLALAGVGVCMKLAHAPVNVQQARMKATTLPSLFYGWSAYSAPLSVPSLAQDDLANLKPVRLPLGKDRSFGAYQPAAIDLQQPASVALPIQVFPWNRFFIDGRPVPAGAVRRWSGAPPGSPGGWDHGPYSAIRVPAGQHLLGYRFVPPSAWTWLFRISLIVVVLWSVGLLLCWVAPALTKQALRSSILRQRTPEDRGRQRKCA
jgi:hypothetical protein